MAECWFSKPKMRVRIPLLASWECGEMVDTYGLDPYANSVWVRIPLFPSALTHTHLSPKGWATPL